jgi:NAD(P)-dependent dehydrogenase (short-subunit alcohol dehydrogenase family)
MSGAVAVITGVGRAGQVGEVVAQAFADAGAVVCAIDRNEDQVRERTAVLSARGARAHAFACDLTDPPQVEAVAARVETLAPQGLQVLVNLAGGFAGGAPVSGLDPQLWHRMFAINATTGYVTTRAFLPLLRRARGSIVFFASSAALPGASVSGVAAYAAAKGAVITLARAVAAEERDHGVRANALAPTSIRTEENLKAMGEDVRYVTREMVANWVLWLASPLSSPVTGQVIKLG